ncbi:MAG: GTP 3',8-cyclase MoaA [SAR202 cluster bacterium]|nr:GTP 3',8-cyclase MoaA [SAR202 cluster bacterium]
MKDKFNRPIKDLRISVIDRCNFRCPYCMPKEIYGERYQFLKNDQLLSFDEIITISEVFSKFGVEKLRITGGEPLLRKDLSLLIKDLKSILGIKEIALTTNGFFLNKYALDLKQSGVDRLTVSLDSLNPETYKKLNGQNLDIKKTLEGIEFAQSIGFENIKINCVVMKGINEEQIIDLVNFGRDNNLIIRFIEYMDVGTINGWKSDDVVYAEDILSIIEKKYELKPVDPNYFGEVATRYKFIDGVGEIGIISSVSKPFCSDCTRARITADGNLYTCLFTNKGHDLKSVIRKRSYKNLEDFIRKIWIGRSDQYSQLRALGKTDKEKVEMYKIGG